MIAALEASTWSDHFMPYGPTKFVNGQNQGGRAVLLQASKTDIDVVWPDEFAARQAGLPAAQGLMPASSARRRSHRPRGAALSAIPGTHWTSIIGAATINGLLIGGIYTLVASGLTLIYGVLHIINFAHGSLLMLAMFGVFYLLTKLRHRPLPVAAGHGAGDVRARLRALQRGVIGRLANGKDENILLVTLGLSILIENLALMFFKGDTRTHRRCLLGHAWSSSARRWSRCPS